MNANIKKNTIKLAEAGLLAALACVSFMLLKIDIPIGTERTSIHIGNTFCALAALLLGPLWGGLSGAIGLTIADLLTGYAQSAPKTFLLKLLIGVITGFIAHKVFEINKSHNKGKIVMAAVVSCVVGLGFNIIADPIVGYLYKTYLLNIPQDITSALAKIAAGTTALNAALSGVLAVLLYLALRPALRKMNMTD